MNTCTVDGCGRPHTARGYCLTHWTRLRKQGDAQPDVPIKAKKRNLFCSVEGCDAPHYCKAMCRNHHARWLRTGSPHAKPPKQKPACTVEGCDNTAKARGFCTTHYRRFLRTGEPGLPMSARGEITYNAAHRRVYRSKGDASTHTCRHCGKAAAHWAYDHADPNAIRDKGSVYSLDPAHYIPLCRVCHVRFDKHPPTLEQQCG